MGIYSMHLLIGRVLNTVFKNRILQGTVWFDLIIFLFGLFMTIVIRVINRKYLKWKWVSYII